MAEDKKKADKRSKKKKKPSKAGKADADAPCTSCAALQRPSSPEHPSLPSPRHPAHTPTHASPVRRSSPTPSCRSRAASPCTLPPHDLIPQPWAHGSPHSRSSEDENVAVRDGWEVQARGRKRSEPSRRVLADVSHSSQSPMAERCSSLASSGSLSRATSPTRPPAPPAAAALPHAASTRGSKLGIASAGDAAPWAARSAGPPEGVLGQLNRPSPPPRSPWGQPTSGLPRTPAIPVPAQADHQLQDDAAALSKSYSLWGAQSLSSGVDASIWQHAPDTPALSQPRPSSAHRPNAWAVPLTASRQQLVRHLSAGNILNDTGTSCSSSLNLHFSSPVTLQQSQSCSCFPTCGGPCVIMYGLEIVLSG